MTRTIFITGGSSGIGSALALEFARRGYGVAVAARRIEKLDALVPELLAAGAPRAIPVQLDVADQEAIPAALAQAAAALGRLDVVVANAGLAHVTPTGKGRMPLVAETINVNLLGAIATIEAALPIMKAQGSGQIVGVTSVAGARGLPGFGAYSASKAGLHRYLQALRAEMHGSTIVVTEIAPGFIDTEINRGLGNRPFVIPVEKGAAVIARMIERKVGMRWVPVLPWTLLIPLLKILPTALVAPKPRRS